jgi:hypothetical protein
MVQPYVLRQHFYKRNSLIFETCEGTVRGTQWAIWALLVDGSKKKDQYMNLKAVDPEHPSFPKTATGERRKRRKFKTEVLIP